ncbi:JAB domain-containing protein [Paenibacillus sp. FSL R10-2736]|uniref:JAB domain-containing protein n=1 Tax=Paenibacillus sp. FSL R10-2736 TaxID=2954692 RepID=UPI0030FBD8B4
MNLTISSDQDLLRNFIPETAVIEVLSKYHSLEELFIHSSIEELLQTSEIGPKRAVQLKTIAELSFRLFNRRENKPTIIRSPKDVYDLCQDLKFQQLEEARIILLNTKNHVLDIRTISLGGLDRALLLPHQVFPEALKRHCAGLILVHCHPSGDPSPSNSDIEVTRRLGQAGEIVGVSVLDHIIIGGTHYCSMKEQGCI